MNIKQLFGNNLHEYRKKRRMSQEQLAEKLEISVKHLSSLETGKGFVSAELLEKISEILEISPAALFYSAEEKSVDENDITVIGTIIEEEFQKAVLAAKERFHILKTNHLTVQTSALENNLTH